MVIERLCTLLRDPTRVGWRVELREPRLTDEQMIKCWSMLTDFADQVTHFDGQKHSKEAWKLAFFHKLGIECKSEYMLSLDGDDIIPIGRSLKDPTKKQASDMIELMYAEGAARGVVFKEKK